MPPPLCIFPGNAVGLSWFLQHLPAGAPLARSDSPGWGPAPPTPRTLWFSPLWQAEPAPWPLGVLSPPRAACSSLPWQCDPSDFLTFLPQACFEKGRIYFKRICFKFSEKYDFF